MCLFLAAKLQVQPSECALMPQPRGALNDLRFVPFDRQSPRQGEVKVGMTVLRSLGVFSIGGFGTLSDTHKACGFPTR